MAVHIGSTRFKWVKSRTPASLFDEIVIDHEGVMWGAAWRKLGSEWAGLYRRPCPEPELRDGDRFFVYGTKDEVKQVVMSTCILRAS